MNVLHVIPSLSPKHGGPSVALPLMARSLVQQGVHVDVATTDDDGPGHHVDVKLNERTERDGYGIWHFRKQTEFYKASLAFRQWINARVRDYDVVHVHALFSFTSNCAARAARRARVPYIIRPLGVLNRWGMENRRRLLKRISFRCLEQPLLRDAAAIHYTSAAEEREASQCGTIGRGVIIPLGIEVQQFASLPSPDLFIQRCPSATGKTVVLFLSRLDAKKGLDLLLPAFARVKQKHPCAVLVLAGSGEPDFVRALQSRATELGMKEGVLFPGFLGGHDKLSAFAAATLYVLPSYSENFGIALVEALAAGLPCVTTEGVAVSEDVRNADAGLIIRPESDALVAAMDRMLSDANLRARVSANARKLAQERFSVNAMGSALSKLYAQVINRT